MILIKIYSIVYIIIKQSRLFGEYTINLSIVYGMKADIT